MRDYKKLSKIYNNTKRFQKKDKFVWCRYFFDDYDFNKRVEFVTNLLQSFSKKNFTIEIQFWEKLDEIKKIVDEFTQEYIVVKQYGNGRKPGILVCQGNVLNILFFSKLLEYHYNYEHAIEPALSMKILLFIENDGSITVFDFYDDRGFIINYYLTK